MSSSDTIADGRYRLLRKLGEGGMGEVYLAEHVHIRRLEAIKVLRASFAENHRFIARFRREARAQNRVLHPNIVAVYDFGRLADGRFFLAMEYVDGIRLDVLRQQMGALPAPRVVGILRQLAAAAAHGHACGVVHRDLKPANLMLVAPQRGQTEVLKVLDFGMAKIVAPDYRETLSPTVAGEIFGTPAYLAPDQLLGRPADARSDIYSIGCIAYELLAGRPPFQGSRHAVLEGHLNRPPRPLGELGELAPEIEAIVMRCLEKDPAGRYQDGGELARALDAVAHPPSPRRVRTLTGFAPLRSDFTHEETDPRALVPHGPRDATVRLSAEEARGVLVTAVRAIADALVDAGDGDPRLIAGVATLDDLERRLARLDVEQSDVERRAEVVAQSARESEAALSFAVGELSFDRDQARALGEADDPERARQIAALEARLAEVACQAQQELATLTERSIALAAARHDLEEAIAAACGELERLVETALARLAEPERRAHEERLRSARAMLRAADG